ncbi:WD40 repeat-like protein [Agrocybe pediades]|nr:WD40 repeat-like protein [Agrocybe pediades]
MQSKSTKSRFLDALRIQRLSRRSVSQESQHLSQSSDSQSSTPNAQPTQSDPQAGTTSEVSAQNLPQRNGSLPWKAMQTALRLLQQNSDGFPPLKTAVGVLVTCLDLTQDIIGNREEYDKLAVELKEMADAFTPYAQNLMERDDGGSVARIVKSINEELVQLKDKLGRGKFKRAIEASEDKDDIVKRYRKIDSLFRRLLSDVTLRTHIEIGKLREATDETLLKTLEPVHDARYNSSYSTTVKRGGCTATTREQILEDLRAWANDSTSAKVFWINGMAGTGKTTISYTFCQWLEDHEQLGGNFFCSRTSSSCRNLNNIVPSLAYQLAHYSPAFRSQLCMILQDKQSPHTLIVEEQFKWVIQVPLEKSKNAIPDGVVIVIDALDECESAPQTRLFLETLLKFASQLPVKFLIASRPEPLIISKMQSPGFVTSTLYLHDIEQSLVESDIKKYLEEALSSMSPVPSEDILDALARRSGKLFIHAATVARYVNPEGIKPSSSKRLQAILDISSPPSSLRYRDIDDLYTTILDAAFDKKKYEDKELDNSAMIVRTVVCAMEPMSTKLLSVLLTIEHQEVEDTLSRLQSVLHVQKGEARLVSILHASFPDFLFDKSRSQHFHCDSVQHHGKLSSFCFDIMDKELRFNICGLESSFLFDRNVRDLQQKIERNISEGLLYACKHWSSHLREGVFTEVNHAKLIRFLGSHLLFWMEVLNVKRLISIGPRLLDNALSWMKGQSSKSKDTKKLYDAREFVEAFSMNACNKSTPHIYVSALPFCPRSSSIYQNYWPKTRGLISANGSLLSEKRKRPIAVWQAHSDVSSLVFSSDGASFAVGSDDGSLSVRDANSGEIISGPHRLHQKRVVSITFSPDNTKIASGSDDNTICAWDVRTGNLIAGPLQKHTEAVYSVSFSHDSTKLVSGSRDGIIMVWDSATGDVISGPFQTTGPVKAVEFTPDGLKIVSISSGDCRISVLDVDTRTILTAPSRAIWIERNPKSIALSSDQSKIAVGYRTGALAIKNPYTGAVLVSCQELSTHRRSMNSAYSSRSVTALTFSHDDKYLISGDSQGTIRVWDAQTGAILSEPLHNKHPSATISLAISPDGSTIISAYNRNSAIVVWTTSNITVVRRRISINVYSLALSPDGRAVIAAGLEDGRIALWDAQTGEDILPAVQASFQPVCSIAFSPDSSKIVAGYRDGAVRLWDTQTEENGRLDMPRMHSGNQQTLSNTLGAEDSVRLDTPRMQNPSWDLPPRVGKISKPAHTPYMHGSNRQILWDTRTGEISRPDNPRMHNGNRQALSALAYSHDGSKIAMGSANNTVKIWDLRSGEVGNPMQGHTGGVNSIVFSPDDSILVSAGAAGKIVVWSVAESKVMWRVNGELGNASANSVAFSPDGTMFVSGLYDGNSKILLWNTATREMTPLQRIDHDLGRVISVAFFQDGKKILSGSSNGAILLWDVETGNILRNFNVGHISSVVISPDCGQLATCGDGGIIRIWEVENAFAAQETVVEDIRSQFNREDLRDSACYSPKSITLAMSRIAKYHADGWVTVNGRNIFWTSPHLLKNICLPYNGLVIGPHGTTFMDYSNTELCIGKKWVNCWNSA